MVDFELSEEVREVRDRVRAFVEEEVLPAEKQAKASDEEIPWKIVEDLRVKARDRDLWAPHMPPEWGGMGLSAVGQAQVHQELGVSPLGPLALNCMAPDEGNMHTVLEFGTEAQKERYLRPLVEGEIRSCFAMTEPDVAGSDPSQIQTRAVKDGDEWVIDGKKWFTSGAKGAAFSIVVAQTDPDAHHYQSATLFIVEEDDPGWEIVREVETMGAHFPGGHPEVKLDGVRIPEDRILGDEGAGLLHAQARLGLGRITHCMRWIGQAQRALDMMTQRAMDREAFGKALSRHQGVQWMVADSGKELYLARMIVLNAAWRIDQGLDHKFEISLAKEYVAGVLNDVMDRAIQVYGAEGYTKDLPLEQFYRDARAARIYDGPDEVHRWVLARELFKTMKADGTTRGLTGGEL